MQWINDACQDHLSQSQIHDLQRVFSKHKAAWLRPRGGRCTATVASLHVRNSRPHKAKLRHLNSVLRNEEKSQVESLLKNGMIRRSTSPWAIFDSYKWSDSS
eukprot:GHVQ01039424.1.p2 GENE.GHVQ01039424.1~~GHVQ01039424.1.p2  ORF type:complete len:102 (-),score=1.02 GHVQ01039424.1:18-323(-)